MNEPGTLEELTDALRERRFRRAVHKLHRCGPRVLAEMLGELGAKHLVRGPIERLVDDYAGLDPATVRRLGADVLPPTPLVAINGGRRDGGAS